VAGVLVPRTGRIVFEGTPLAGVPAHRAARLGLRLVPEGRGLRTRMSGIDQDGRELRRRFALLAVAATATSLWILLPIPAWLGTPLLWHTVPAKRMWLACGLLGRPPPSGDDAVAARRGGCPRQDVLAREEPRILAPRAHVRGQRLAVDRREARAHDGDQLGCGAALAATSCAKTSACRAARR
jgi:hypothetical protein